jgi:hypothetical protein
MLASNTCPFENYTNRRLQIKTIDNDFRSHSVLYIFAQDKFLLLETTSFLRTPEIKLPSGMSKSLVAGPKITIDTHSPA